MVGAPAHLLSNKNSKSGAAPPGAGFNIREQVLRPSNTKPGPSTHAGHRFCLSPVIFLLFARKEIKYAFPAIGFMRPFRPSATWMNRLGGHCYMEACSSRRIWLDRLESGIAKDTVVRIGYSSGQSITNAAGRLPVSHTRCCLLPSGWRTIILRPASFLDRRILFAALLTATGTMCFKRMECWYWIAGACAAGIASYLMKHYLFNSCYHALLLIVSVYGLSLNGRNA